MTKLLTISDKKAAFSQRAKGSLYGLILGDIIGSYFEFSSRGKKTIPPLNELLTCLTCI